MFLRLGPDYFATFFQATMHDRYCTGNIMAKIAMSPTILFTLDAINTPLICYVFPMPAHDATQNKPTKHGAI